MRLLYRKTGGFGGILQPDKKATSRWARCRKRIDDIWGIIVVIILLNNTPFPHKNKSISLKKLKNKNFSFIKRKTLMKNFIRAINMAPPAGLEPATYGLTVHRSTDWTKEEKMVPRGGIEPPTRGFSIPCSTDWAIEATRRLRGALCRLSLGSSNTFFQKMKKMFYLICFYTYWAFIHQDRGVIL